MGDPDLDMLAFPAQQIPTQLVVSAHNTLFWARRWLANVWPRLVRFGLKRWVRDVLHLNGVVVFDQNLHIIHLILNPGDPLACVFAHGLAALLAGEHVAVYLGET